MASIDRLSELRNLARSQRHVPLRSSAIFASTGQVTPRPGSEFMPGKTPLPSAIADLDVTNRMSFVLSVTQEHADLAIRIASPAKLTF